MNLKHYAFCCLAAVNVALSLWTANWSGALGWFVAFCGMDLWRREVDRHKQREYRDPETMRAVARVCLKPRGAGIIDDSDG